jgi:hypothetical protein
MKMKRYVVYTNNHSPQSGKTVLSSFYSYDSANEYKKCLENDYKDYIHTKTYMYAPIDSTDYPNEALVF